MGLIEKASPPGMRVHRLISLGRQGLARVAKAYEAYELGKCRPKNHDVFELSMTG